MNGHKDFNFQLDGSGHSQQSFSKLGLGLTVNYNCNILRHEGIYQASIDYQY